MISEQGIAHPKIVSRSEWLAARKEILRREKELTREYDRLAAARRRLPMVPVEKDYTFEGTDGPVRLIDLFEGRRQLIVYHFMFDPTWEKGCPGCTSYIDAINDLSLLAERDTSFVIVSRAPLEKLEAYRREKGWKFKWVSSFGSDFNYDFHVTLDEQIAPLEYNFLTGDELAAKHDAKGEKPGLSVFFRLGNEIFHTYSTYARGGEALTDSYRLLDVTPYGRQEDFEDSPEGWPQRPTYG